MMTTSELQKVLKDLLETYKEQINYIKSFSDIFVFEGPFNMKNTTYAALRQSDKVAVLENLACMYAILKNGKISVIIRTYTPAQIQLEAEGDKMTIGYFKLPDRFDLNESRQMIRDYLIESRQLLKGLIDKLPISFKARNA